MTTSERVAWLQGLLDKIVEGMRQAELQIERLEEQQDVLEAAMNALSLYDRFQAMQETSTAWPSEKDVIVTPTVTGEIEDA